MRHHRHAGLLLLGLWGLAGCSAYDEPSRPKYGAIAHKEQLSADVEKSPCSGALRSNCGDTQEAYLEALLKNLEIYGLNKTARNLPTEAAPTLNALPKDRFGGVNWTKAAVEGVIRPRDTIGEDETGRPSGPVRTRDDLISPAAREDEHFQKLIVIQVKNHFMADVLFPHGMHTCWVGCNSCHPKPFATRIGATKMSFQGILAGDFCGKCHGKVAFPLEPFDNCRRCHVLPKQL